MQKIFFILLAGAALFVGSHISATAQSPGALKIKKAVQKIGVNGDITVVRVDDQWSYGSIQKIDDTSFTIHDIEQKVWVNLGYDQVKKVFKGYGQGGFLHQGANGHRIPPSRHRIGLIFGAALIGFLVVIAAVGLRD
jgi:hypothetical protein